MKVPTERTEYHLLNARNFAVFTTDKLETLQREHANRVERGINLTMVEAITIVKRIDATPVEDKRPAGCRFRLKDEKKPYPKSSCHACKATVITGLGKQCHVSPIAEG